MTREEAIKQIKWYFEMDDGIAADDATKRAINMAINALGEQPRPIDPTVEVDLASGVVPKGALNGVVNSPKVTIHVNRPKGHWITKWSGNGWNEDWDYTCSVCGKEYEKASSILCHASYCPGCGADMRGGQE